MTQHFTYARGVYEHKSVEKVRIEDPVSIFWFWRRADESRIRVLVGGGESSRKSVDGTFRDVSFAISPNGEHKSNYGEENDDWSKHYSAHNDYCANR